MSLQYLSVVAMMACCSGLWKLPCSMLLLSFMYSFTSCDRACTPPHRSTTHPEHNCCHLMMTYCRPKITTSQCSANHAQQ